MRVIAMIGLAVLAGCGADDPPLRPTANLGVSIGQSGVTTSANLAATNGTISVGLGL